MKWVDAHRILERIEEELRRINEKVSQFEVSNIIGRFMVKDFMEDKLLNKNNEYLESLAKIIFSEARISKAMRKNWLRYFLRILEKARHEKLYRGSRPTQKNGGWDESSEEEEK